MNNKITTKMNVKDNLINIMIIDNIDYIFNRFGKIQKS